MLYVLICTHWGHSNEYTQYTIFVKKIEKIFPNYHYFLPNLAPWLTLSSSNNPYLEQIFMVPKMFDPLRFGCIGKLYFCLWIFFANKKMLTEESNMIKKCRVTVVKRLTILHNVSRNVRKRTFWHMCQTKIQINLCILIRIFIGAF